jgi:hypothetical protein
MANHEHSLTAATVESPLLSNGHGGFGERSGETGRWQHRNRAPGRLDTLKPGTPMARVAAVQRTERFQLDSLIGPPRGALNSQSAWALSPPNGR